MAIYPGKTKGTWRVVVWAKPAPGAKSKAHEKIVKGKWREALLFESRWCLDLEKHAVREYRTAPTFEEFSRDSYQPFIKARVSKSTWDNAYRWSLMALTEHFGRMRIPEISQVDVESFQSNWDGKPGTVNGYVVRLKSVLKYAHTRHRIEVQAFPDLEPLEDPRGHVKAWTLAQCGTLLATAHATSAWQVPMIIFGLNTGVRKGEIIACEWEWIDFPGQMIRIPVNEFWHPKNKKPREVPMAPVVRAMLEGPRKRIHSRWVFPNRDGVRHGDYPDKMFTALLERAGIEGSPHWMRHTFASQFLAAKPDLPLLGKLLGHSGTYVTELYGHLLPDHLATARGVVNIGQVTKTMAPTLAEKRK